MVEYNHYLATWGPGLFEWPVIALLGLIILVPFWKICSKAGFSPYFSILIFIPGINVLFLWWLAFSKWPALPE
jgi:hypothetical protein